VSIVRRRYTGSFWCELRALLAVGWLKVVDKILFCFALFMGMKLAFLIEKGTFLNS
jgi:hypothetical protein